MLMKQLLYLRPTFRKESIFLQKMSDVSNFFQVFSITGKVQSTLVNFDNNDLHNAYDCEKFDFQIQNLKNKGKNINGSDIVSVTKSLLLLCSSQNVNLKMNQQILFNKMCHVMNSNSNKLKIEEIIHILKYCLKYKVSSSENMISFILKHLNKSLQNVSFENIVALSAIISKLPESKRTTAMKQKLNNCLIMELTTNFDKSNVDILINALRTLSFNLDTDERSLKIIINALKDHNLKNTSISNIVLLMKLFININYNPPELFEILCSIQTILNDNIEHINKKDMNFILKGITSKVKNGQTQFYNAEFLNHCAKILIQNDADFEDSIDCLKAFNQLKHINKEILSYVCAKYYEAKYIYKVFIDNEFYKIRILLCGLAFLKYKPNFWEEIRHPMTTQKLLKCEYQTLVEYSLHLACLESYDEIILKHIFQNNSYIKNNEYTWNFLTLYQKLKSLPNFNQHLPLLTDFEPFKYLHKTATHSLLSTLQNALGGPMYVKANLKSRLFHHIDYVVAFRDMEYPIAINNIDQIETQIKTPNPEYLEDLQIPSNCQIIAILDTPDTWYSRNECLLLGPFSMYIESLEALSYKVVTISENVWKQLPEKSKIPFIMDKLHSKLCYREKFK